MRNLTILLLVLFANVAGAITVQIDYSTDSTNFFGNAVAKATLEKAAADISAAITSNLSVVTTGSYTGKSGQQSATVTWSFDLESPSTGLPVSVPSFTMPANVFRVYTGAMTLSDRLGVGGPIGYELSASIGSDAAFTNAANSANSALSRGGGPTILSGQLDDPPQTLSVGAIAGTLSIDNTTNWHLDYSTPVEAGEFDLYTVALHEMIHALGFGTSDTWTGLVDNQGHWLGSNVLALTNTTDVLNVFNADHGIDLEHIKDGLKSISIETGGETEAVMASTLASGTRKTLTALDLAFLRDIGFETIVAVPEPSMLALGALAILALGAARYSSRRQVV